MSQNVARLKELLFDSENATLAELQQRVEQLAASEQTNRQELAQSLTTTFETAVATEAAGRQQLAQQVAGLLHRAGSEDRFRTSVADVLDGALREAEVKRHDQLTRAVAPLVVRTIKTELRNSQDEMVEALYPITGRLVKAYIASAMKDLMDQINRRLAGGTNPVMLRLRSLITGRSVAELALAEAQRLEVVELFLIRRGSGELVQHWPDGPQGPGVPSNSDIHLSGVLTAINDFAAAALKDDGGNLRSFSLDDFQMYLRGSPAFLLAAKCRGAAPAGVEAVLDDEFLRMIERNGQALSGAADGTPPLMLAPLAQSLAVRLDEQQRAIAAEAGLGFNPLKALAIIVAVPLALYAGWTFYANYETSQVREFASRTIATTTQLAGYPIQLDVGARGREVTLIGLVPTTGAKSEVIKRLRDGLPGSDVADRLTVLPNIGAELEPQVTSVRRSLAGIEGEALRGSIRRAISRAVRRLDQTLPHLRRLDLALENPGTRAKAKAAATSIERFASEARTLLTQAGAGPVDMSQMTALSVPMHGLSERLKQTSVELSTLLTRGSSGLELAHADAEPADALESAEELSLSAEQLATVAVAVAQAAGISPVVPPPPAPAAPSARDRLEQWTKTSAIFFGDGSDFRNPQLAQTALDTAARLIRDADMLVRVVGYTDERGGQARNSPLSQTRAQRVVDALIERGVPRRLLVAVGRPTGADISSVVGPQSPNRRVEFEVGFDGEMADQP